MYFSPQSNYTQSENNRKLYVIKEEIEYDSDTNIAPYSKNHDSDTHNPQYYDINIRTVGSNNNDDAIAYMPFKALNSILHKFTRLNIENKKARYKINEHEISVIMQNMKKLRIKLHMIASKYCEEHKYNKRSYPFFNLSSLAIKYSRTNTFKTFLINTDMDFIKKLHNEKSLDVINYFCSEYKNYLYEDKTRKQC